MLEAATYSIHRYRVDIGRASGEIEVTAGVITDADPTILRYLGARLDHFRVWVERKGGMVRKLDVPGRARGYDG